MHQSIDKKNKVIIYLIFLLILSTTKGKILEQQKRYSLKINDIKVYGLTISKNLEINTQPGMTKLSLVPEIANYTGISFIKLIEWILKDASINR